MPKKEVAVIFTAKSVETILAEGGTSSWRLDRNHARQCPYVVCTRNAHAEWVQGPEPHHSAFIVGKVSDVVPSPTREERFLIQFSEYALVNIPDVWKGDRNPVRYSSADELGIDFDKLDWKPLSELTTRAEAASITPPARRGNGEVQALTMTEAKKGLALTFGVAPEAIEITIRG